MLKSPTVNFSVSSILIHKYSVVEKIQKQVDMFCNIANISQRELPVPVLGCVGDKFYLLTGYDVFYGVQQSRLDNIECVVRDFNDDVEFLIEHVRLNKNPIAFNSLKLFPLIEYFKTKGIKDEQISGLLQIHDTIHEKILTQNLTVSAVKEFSNLFSLLSQNLTNPTIPFYVIKQVANCDMSEQQNAVLLIRDYINSQRITDSRFNWPSYEELEIQLNNPEFYQEKQKSVIVIPKGDDEPTISEMSKAEQINSQLKNSIIIPASPLHPQMIVNKKTNEVKIVSEKENIIKLESKENTPMFVLSSKVIENLDFQEPIEVKLFNFKTIIKLKQFLDTHSEIHGVLMYK